MCGVSICEEQAKFSLSTKKSKVFHHTQTQTKQSMNTGRERTNLKSCNTQTYKMISRTCQSNHERSTQIESSLIRESPSIIGSIGDEKMLTPKQYFSSDQLFALKYQKTILLQKNWRGYAGRKQGICSKLTLQTKHRNVQKEIYFSEGREGGDYILFEMKDSNRKITADSPSIETVKRSKYIRGSSTELIDLKSTKANTTIPRRLQRLIEPTEWTLSNEVVVQVQNPSTVRAEKWVSLYKKISQVDHVCGKSYLFESNI